MRTVPRIRMQLTNFLLGIGITKSTMQIDLVVCFRNKAAWAQTEYDSLDLTASVFGTRILKLHK